MRGSLLALVLVLALSPQAPTEAELVGAYECVGINPDGTLYRGTTDIAHGRDGVWAFHWLFPPNGEAFGIGLLKGDTFSVIFETDGGLIGLALFTIDRRAGMQLTGPWVSPMAPGLGTETLTKRGVGPA